MDRYGGFALDTHERHRQQRLRMAEHEQSSGSKGTNNGLPALHESSSSARK
jgi:hypothetical protein